MGCVPSLSAKSSDERPLQMSKQMHNLKSRLTNGAAAVICYPRSLASMVSCGIVCLLRNLHFAGGKTCSLEWLP